MTDSIHIPDQVNIAAALVDMARRQPFTQAVIFPQGRDRLGRVAYTHLTYSQLEGACNRMANGLASIGIGRGTRTVLMVKPSLEFFALTFALFKMGAVPIMIDPGMGLKNLKKCLGEARPEAFVGIFKAHLARVLLRWPKPRVSVLVGRGRFPGCYNLDLLSEKASPHFPTADTKAEELAAILFTSGSTGVPKGAEYTHKIFAAQIQILQRVYQIQPGEIDLATFPLFALFAPALGMSALIPDMDFTKPALVEPRKIIEAVENFGVTNMFGSPALINRVGRFGVEHHVRLPSLKRVISAGAPVPANVLARFSSMLAPGIEIFTPYGATESLPVASMGSAAILAETAAGTDQGKGVCVGRPVPGIEAQVIRLSDEAIANWSNDLVLPPGRIGEITVKGPVVTNAYFRGVQATQMAKIRQDDQVWHRMGDLGYYDDQGRLWFCGRKTQRVRVQGRDFFTICCEGIFNTHPLVFRTALVGVGAVDPGPVDYREAVLCVELEREAGGADREKLKAELLELGSRHEHTASIRRILFHPGFPVDIRHNAKIFREKLGLWAEGQ